MGNGRFLPRLSSHLDSIQCRGNLGQGLLHAASLLSPMQEITSPILGGIVLIATGIFQFTPFKQACLNHCRTPMGYFMTEWRDGQWGAFVMGVRHGAYCVGCCWLLMALLFVSGLMNLFSRRGLRTL